jgi:hypothetical protein
VQSERDLTHLQIDGAIGRDRRCLAKGVERCAAAFTEADQEESLGADLADAK